MASTTEALNNRTERHVWMDILVARGGTVGFNDTIPQLLRKIVLAMGGTYNCCSRPTEYQMMRTIYTLATGLPAPTLGKDYIRFLTMDAASSVVRGDLLLNTGENILLNDGTNLLLDHQ